MKNNRIKTVIGILTLSAVLGCTAYAEAPEQNPAGSEVAEEGTDAMPDPLAMMAGMMASMGSANRGFDAMAFVQGEGGQWIMNQMQYVMGGYDQMSPEVVEHWASIGMEKQYFEGDEAIKEWSLFTPMDLEEGKEYPALFAMHMGGTNIFFGEWMGYVENAAEKDYIVVCPSWSIEGATEEQIAAFENSGMESYEAYAFKTVLERAKEIAPIEISKVYVAGFSGGGNASALAAMECPTLIAGCSPATGAAIQTFGGDELSQMAQYGMGMMMCYGTMDAEERWPIIQDAVELGDVSNYRTIQERIDNVNSWTLSCGADTDPVTEEMVKELADKEESTASSIFGLNFDKEYEKEYETNYYFGDFCNSDDQTVVRYMAIEGNPHFVSKNWAPEVYDFLSRFSRNPETGKLVIEE